jgi:hypothetical protein
MVFQHGSKHRRIAALNLIATLDDATEEVYSALQVEEEGTMSSFLGLAVHVRRAPQECNPTFISASLT